MRVRPLHLFALLALLILVIPSGANAQPPAAVATPSPQEIGPGQVVGLSPDGGSIANFDSQNAQICILDAATLASKICADLRANQIEPQIEFIVWSPDSTRLAIAETGFETLLDGDLWVMDTATGKLTDLTPDGNHHRSVLRSDEYHLNGTAFMDITPAWSPDGKTIAFSRSPIGANGPEGDDLAIVSASGGPVRTVLKITDEEPGVLYYGICWSPDGATIYYSLADRDPTSPDNGIYRVGLDGTGNKKLVGADSRLGAPAIIQVNATGKTGLVTYPVALEQFGPADGSVVALLDLSSGTLTPIDVPAGEPAHSFVRSATFSPGGGSVLIAVTLVDGGSDVFIRDLATNEDVRLGKTPRLIATGVGRGLDWSSNGTIFAVTADNQVVLIQAPGGGQPPAASTPAASPVASVRFAEGATVVTNDDAKLRSAPSTDAGAVLDVPKGTNLVVLGAPRNADDLTWWPVEEPKTGTIGWIRDDVLNSESD